MNFLLKDANFKRIFEDDYISRRSKKKNQILENVSNNDNLNKIENDIQELKETITNLLEKKTKKVNRITFFTNSIFYH